MACWRCCSRLPCLGPCLALGLASLGNRLGGLAQGRGEKGTRRMCASVMILILRLLSDEKPSIERKNDVLWELIDCLVNQGQTRKGSSKCHPDARLALTAASAHFGGAPGDDVVAAPRWGLWLGGARPPPCFPHGESCARLWTGWVFLACCACTLVAQVPEGG